MFGKRGFFFQLMVDIFTGYSKEINPVFNFALFRLFSVIGYRRQLFKCLIPPRSSLYHAINKTAVPKMIPGSPVLSRIFVVTLCFSSVQLQTLPDGVDYLGLLHLFYDRLAVDHSPLAPPKFIQNLTSPTGRSDTKDLTIFDSLSPACKSDLKVFLKGFFLLSAPWSWAMLDATGKLPAGLASGNFFALGSYGQCLNASRYWDNATVTSTSVGNESTTRWHPPIWLTKPKTAPAYCSVAIDVSQSVWGSVTASRFRSWSNSHAVVPIFLRVPGLFFYQGMCLPSACSALDVALIADRGLGRIWAVLNFPHLHGPYPDQPYVSRVVCTDANHTTTWWTTVTPVDIPNGTTPIIPVVYDPIDQAKRAAKRKKLDTITGFIMFGGVFLALAAAVFWDRVYPECRRRLVTMQVDDDDTDGLLTGGFHHGPGSSSAAHGESLHPVDRHIRNVAACLSPFRNLVHIFHRDDTAADNLPVRQATDQPGSTSATMAATIDALVPGLRGLSVLWIIYAQVYALAPAYTLNSADMVSRLADFPFLSLNGATFAIDTFLFLSGLSVASTMARPQFSFDGVRPWLAAYAYRLARYTPLYAAVITFVVTFGPYLGSGPLWLTVAQPALGDGLDGNCRLNWWTNLLYVNNFVHSQQACLPWTWFLANEAQFFLLAPLLVFLFRRSPTLGTVVMAHFMLATLIASFTLSYVNGYRSTFSLFDPRLAPYFYDYYIRPYVRMAPYLVGLLFGCYVYFFSGSTASERGDEDEGISVDDVINPLDPRIASNGTWAKSRRLWARVGRAHTNNPAKRALTWVLWVGLLATLVYGVRYDVITSALTTALTPLSRHAPLLRAAYNALAHLVWALALVGILWLLNRNGMTRTKGTGTGFFAFRFLTAAPWIPFSNLTYAIYLIHPVVILTVYQSSRNALYFTHFGFFLTFLALSSLTFVIAIPFTLAFETPIINLARIYGSHLIPEP